MVTTKKSNHLTGWGIIVFLTCCLLTAGNARAAGTPAGTTVTSTVSVSYNLGGAALNAVVAHSFVVDQVVNMTVTKNSDMSASPNQQNVPLTFRVTNTGNAAQRYALQVVSKATNSWTMNNVRLYRDNNSSGSWDTGDTLYADAGTFGDLQPDASTTVLIVADTPNSVVSGQICRVRSRGNRGRCRDPQRFRPDGRAQFHGS